MHKRNRPCVFTCTHSFKRYRYCYILHRGASFSEGRCGVHMQGAVPGMSLLAQCDPHWPTAGLDERFPVTLPSKRAMVEHITKNNIGAGINLRAADLGLENHSILKNRASPVMRTGRAASPAPLILRPHSHHCSAAHHHRLSLALARDLPRLLHGAGRSAPALPRVEPLPWPSEP